LFERGWAAAHGPASPGLLRHLERFGSLYDAVFFSGEWGPLVIAGQGRVRRAVLAPAPCEDPTRAMPHARGLLAAAHALAVATQEEREAVAIESRAELPERVFVIGACAGPAPRDRQGAPSPLPVTGPYVLHVGPAARPALELLEAFRAFHDAHARTPFEDDAGRPLLGGDVRLILATAC
jgi:hypothetical protein